MKSFAFRQELGGEKEVEEVADDKVAKDDEEGADEARDDEEGVDEEQGRREKTAGKARLLW